MNRGPVMIVVVIPAIAGALCVILAIATRTGTTGAYVCLYIALPILIALLFWAERKGFLTNEPENRPDHRDRRPRRHP